MTTESTLQLTTDTIELYKVLKLEGLVASGAEAKLAIAEGSVKVNGKVELRKRNKLKAGDVVSFDEYTITITNG
jgi:ribosome-associated protein